MPGAPHVQFNLETLRSEVRVFNFSLLACLCLGCFNAKYANYVLAGSARAPRAARTPMSCGQISSRWPRRLGKAPRRLVRRCYSPA